MRPLRTTPVAPTPCSHSQSSRSKPCGLANPWGARSRTGQRDEAERDAQMTQRVDATRALYAALDADQQKVFDSQRHGGFQRAGMQGERGMMGKHHHGGHHRMGGMGGGVTVNVTGGLATSAEIGQAVVNAIRAYNRSAGPANIQVA